MKNTGGLEENFKARVAATRRATLIRSSARLCLAAKSLLPVLFMASAAFAQWPEAVDPRPTSQPRLPMARPAVTPGEDSGVVIVDNPRGGFELIGKDASPLPTASAPPTVAAVPPGPVTPPKPVPQTGGGDEISEVLNQMAPGQEPTAVHEKQDQGDAVAILERARQQWAFLGDARTVYLDCELVLVQPPSAFDASLKSLISPDRSILRSERYLGWDARQVAAYVKSDQGEVWAQWLGTEGYSEQVPSDGADKVRASKRARDLSQVLNWTISPFATDVCLPAWWVSSSRRDLQAWRPASAYSVIGPQTFLGKPCLVLGFDDGKERGEEWYDQASGRLIRLRTYLTGKTELPGREATATPAPGDASRPAPGTAVRRDRIFQDYREVAPGRWLPMQTVESIRSSTTGELISVLHLKLRSVKLDETLPAWLFDPQREGPPTGRTKTDLPSL